MLILTSKDRKPAVSPLRLDLLGLMLVAFWSIKCANSIHGTSSCLVDPPQPAQGIGYINQTLNLTCTICAHNLYWLVNDEIVFDDQFPQTLLDSTYPQKKGVLTIKGSPSLNNSEVKCAMSLLRQFQESQPVLIQLQSLLGPPTELNYAIQNNSVYFFWVPPFTLPGTSMEFVVTVTIAGQSSSLVTPVNAHTFLDSDLNISRCESNHTVEFVVYGLNKAGKGEPAFLVIKVPNDPSSCSISTVNKLSPPMDLAVSIKQNSLLVHWAPPFTFSQITCYVIEVISQEHHLFFLDLMVRTNHTFHQFTWTSLEVADCCTRTYRLMIVVYGVTYAGAGESSNQTVVVNCCSTDNDLPVTTNQAPQHTTKLEGNVFLHAGIAVSLSTLLTVIFIVITCCIIILWRKPKTKICVTHEILMEPNNSYDILKASDIHTEKKCSIPLETYRMAPNSSYTPITFKSNTATQKNKSENKNTEQNLEVKTPIEGTYANQNVINYVTYRNQDLSKNTV